MAGGKFHETIRPELNAPPADENGQAAFFASRTVEGSTEGYLLETHGATLENQSKVSDKKNKPWIARGQGEG